ncbi:hypothetical protein ACSW9V_15095 (plasmid) [Clostridium perfringens]|uniref:hypothetical protein n=1 Tax=Clostridium perfringens TaxID=1502 RepID=UPI000B3A5488|nr:hypothetical protein [Clostridium perfringens]EGT0690807.1 hypothetical protein [Clostridium perfringens]EGT0693586.1 hypothetical protein [Clostridium perfringens]EGT0696543.1 hypothetical protein [Clostridium perfringens]MDU3376208.1 hypothetical protein [Clostridium perfringens]MDU3534164.1 hypothetical protein [Clostridium perfringens]
MDDINALESKMKRISYELYNIHSDNLITKIKKEMANEDFLRTGEVKKSFTLYLGDFILNDYRCHRYNVAKGSKLQREINCMLYELYKQLLESNGIYMYELEAYKDNKAYLTIFISEDTYIVHNLIKRDSTLSETLFLIKYHFKKKKMKQYIK